MVYFKNDRVAYHIERQLRRGRSKIGIWSYLADKGFLLGVEERDEIGNKLEIIFNLIKEEGIGVIFYNKGNDRSPKFWFEKTTNRANKFITLN